MKILNSIALIALTLHGCSKHERGEEPTKPVEVARVEKKDVPRYVKCVGQLVASVEVEIKPQVHGILTHVLFEEGELIDKGDLLMTIDDRPYRADLASAKAGLQKNEADLVYYSDLTETFGKLVGQEYVSRLEYEQGRQQREGAVAEIVRNKAAIEKAEINIGYTKIYSPIRGYIGSHLVDAGNFVSTSQNTPLATIRKVEPINAQFSVPSCYVDKMREEQAKEPLLIEADKVCKTSTPLKGEVFFIDNHVDKKTGMIKVKALIPNKDLRGWPGEFVRVNLLLDTFKDATTVPEAALIQGQNKYFVYVLDEETMRVEMRMIKKVYCYNRECVLAWGVKPGEIVVTSGQQNLIPNVKVHITHD